MKKIKTIQLVILSIFSCIVVFSSCKKKDDTTITPAAETGTLLFHLHTNADTNEVESYGDTMVMTGGRRIVVTKAQLYISGIQLVKSDGSVIAGPAINVLKVQETEPYTIGTVAAGNYKSVKFNVGLSSATNASSPSSSDQTLHQPEMWFDNPFLTSSGFIFVNFSGLIDTATTPNDTNPLVPFSYKIGTNAHLKNVSMPNQNFTVAANQAVEVHIIIDYAQLFSGVLLSDPGNLQINTAADNSSALSNQVSNNIPSMFSYEQ